MTTDTAIAFDHVEKHFRLFASPLHRIKEALHPTGKIYHTPLPVLRDVSFRIPQGQAVGILGPNGVGKSTLLHLVAGVLEPSAGARVRAGKAAHACDAAPDVRARCEGSRAVSAALGW